MKSKILTALLSAAMLANLPAYAITDSDMRDDGQESEVKKVLYGNLTDKQIYTLNNYAADAKTSGASVDIITREDINDQNSPFISQLLNQTMSLTYGQGSGGMGQPAKLMIRGSDRVLFTIDGVRIDRVEGTARTTEIQNFLLSDDYERIEVVRGANGTIAGHTASGGIVAMQTRRGSGRLRTEAESMFGSYGSFKERFAVMGGGDKFDHYTAVTWFKTDDGTKYEGYDMKGNNSYNNLNVVTNYGLRVLDGKAEIRNIARYNRAKKFMETNPDHDWMGIHPDKLDDYATNHYFTDSLTWKHEVNDKWDYDLHANVFNSKYTSHYGEYGPYTYWGWTMTDPASTSTYNGTRFNLGTQQNIKLADWNKLSVGYNYEIEHARFGATDMASESASTQQHDVYAQDCINIKDILFIRGGARMMTNSKYGTWVMPNASGALVLPTFKLEGAKTTLRGSWGMNVNNPTLYQRYGFAGYGYLPNPNLDPERVNSWDVGINQSFFDDKLSFDFGYFDSRYKNYIGYDYPMYKNMAKVNMSGYEGKITWKPNEKFKFVVNYTYTDAENKETHSQVPLVSKNRVNGTIVWTPVERFSAYVGVEGGDARNYDANGTKKLSGYVDVNLGGLVRLFTWKDAKFYLQGDLYNLLNQKIACGYHYGGAGGKIYRSGLNFRVGLFIKYDLPEKSKENL